MFKRFFFLFFLCFSQVQAKLPFNVFKGSTVLFLDINQAPIFGMAALESGLIQNIRFNMMEKQAFLKDGQRNYINDTGRDPHWNIVKLLFPSNNGALGITVNHYKNLAQYMGFDHVAVLMEYAHMCRQNIRKHTSMLWQQKKITQVINELLPHNLKAENKVEVTVLFKKLLNYIRIAIDNEERNKNCLFPKGTVDQIISAFLCEKADTQHDLEDYINQMVLVGLAHRPVHLVTFEKHHVDQIIARISHEGDPKQRLEDFYHLGMAPYFTMKIPYKADIDLLNNGLAQQVEGPRSVVQPSKPEFADCNETLLRHIMNLMTYDYRNRRFDLSHLPKGPRQKQIKEFYAMQDITNVNNGSKPMRTAWNRVVGDLNSLPGPGHVLYRADGKNEIVSGLVNLLHVFEKVLGVHLIPSSHDPLDQKVLQGFERLFHILAPHKTVELEWVSRDVHSTEVFGGILVKVTVDNFSYQFIIDTTGFHGSLENLKLHFTEEDGVRLGVMREVMPRTSIQESLMLVDRDVSSHVSQLLYKLFPTPISDNLGKIKFVKTLSEIYTTLSVNTDRKLIDVILYNFLVDFAFNNVLIHQMTPHILRLANEGYNGVALSKVVSKLKLSYMTTSMDGIGHFTNLEELDMFDAQISSVTMPHLPHLKDVIMPGNAKQLTGLENLPNLEILNMHSSSIQTVHFPSMPNLKTLSLSDSIRQFDVKEFSKMPALKSLHLRGEVHNLDGLGALSNLESLRIGIAYSNNNFEMPHLPRLKELVISSGVGKLSGLESLPVLEKLECVGSASLWELMPVHIPNMPHLITLTLSRNFSDIKLDRLDNLIELDVSFNKTKRTIDISHLRNLHFIQARDSDLHLIGRKADWEVTQNLQEYLKASKEIGPDGKAVFKKSPKRKLILVSNNTNIQWIEEGASSSYASSSSSSGHVHERQS